MDACSDGNTYINAFIYSGLNETSGILFNFFEYYFGLGPFIYNLYNIQNIYGVIFVMTISLYPYVYLLCLPAFANQSFSVFEVGKSLGLSKYQRLRRIGIPIIRPSVIAGVSFVIMRRLQNMRLWNILAYLLLQLDIQAWFVLGDDISSSLILYTTNIGLFFNIFRRFLEAKGTMIIQQIKCMREREIPNSSVIPP